MKTEGKHHFEVNVDDIIRRLGLFTRIDGEQVIGVQLNPKNKFQVQIITEPYPDFMKMKYRELKKWNVGEVFNTIYSKRIISNRLVNRVIQVTSNRMAEVMRIKDGEARKELHQLITLNDFFETPYSQLRALDGMGKTASEELTDLLDKWKVPNRCPIRITSK